MIHKIIPKIKKFLQKEKHIVVKMSHFKKHSMVYIQDNPNTIFRALQDSTNNPLP
jgi:hypothetical protein